MEGRVREGLLLFREYCMLFGLKITTDGKLLGPHSGPDEQLIAGAFLGEGDGLPPIASVTTTGDIIMEQDEDLLRPGEKVTDIIPPDLVRVAITQRKPIHPVMDGEDARV